jgi:hypothetical protein
MKLALLCLLLAGCAAPQIDATGTVTCATFATLTTRATTVYINADAPGTVVVQPDCTVAVTVK